MKPRPTLGMIISGAAIVVAALMSASCGSGVSPREAALRSTVEAMRDEISQIKSATPAAVSTPSATPQERLKFSDPRQKESWVANHKDTTLWSAPTGGTALTQVPQWRFMLVMEPQLGERLRVFYPGGQGNSYVGEGWVDAKDFGPVGSVPAAVDLSDLPKERATATAVSTPRVSTSLSPIDSRLLDWRSLDLSATVSDFTLAAHGTLKGQDSYGGPYGAKIAASRGQKILLVDTSLQYAFRPGTSPVEVHVDFFVIGDSAGNEYRGIPIPMSNALPDRFYLSPGQTFRGIVAFIVPDSMRTARFYFTNFLGNSSPPERLTLYLNEIQ